MRRTVACSTAAHENSLYEVLVKSQSFQKEKLDGNKMLFSSNYAAHFLVFQFLNNQNFQISNIPQHSDMGSAEVFVRLGVSFLHLYLSFILLYKIVMLYDFCVLSFKFSQDL